VPAIGALIAARGGLAVDLLHQPAAGRGCSAPESAEDCVAEREQQDGDVG
jgi:hypothetical protein